MSETAASTTLLFRHLPNDLSQDERKDLLHHLGATQVRVFGKHGRMKNTAFAVFKDQTQAKQIVSQLHQVEFLGSRLVVEFAQKDEDKGPSIVDKDGVSLKLSETASDGEGPQGTDSAQGPRKEPREIRFDDTFHTWGVHQPRRPDLRYKYPPPTPSILTNILHALAATPSFYVQVLHLMNKMDLPAPFGMVTPPPPVRPDIRPVDDVAQREMDISSSAESELDSDGDQKQRAPQAERPVRSVKRKRLAVKRPRLSDLQDGPPQPPPPSGHLSLAVSEIFDSAAPARKVPLKLPAAIPPPSLPQPHPRQQQEQQQQQQQLQQQQQQQQGLRDLNLPPLPPLPPQPPPPIAAANGAEPGSQGQSSQQNFDLYDPSCPLPVPSDNLNPSLTGPSQPAEESLEYGPKLPPSLPASSGLLSDTTQTVPDSVDNQSGPSTVGGFGLLQPVEKPKDPSDTEESLEKEWTKGKFISSSQLRRNRVSKSEMQDLSVYRRYAEGQPSCRLYIKNLAKQVSEEDLHWIYGRYVNWNREGESSIFDIRLMREGRMKGQAFVTLPTENAATEALKDTNGFLLAEKPMVVQFARSARAEEDKASVAKEK